jgi:hypothetical protein
MLWLKSWTASCESRSRAKRRSSTSCRQVDARTATLADLSFLIRLDFLDRRFRGPSSLADNHVVPTRDNESSVWVKCWAEALGYDAV